MDMDYTKNFSDVFAFVRNDREDVRRMALEGLAQHSKDNVHLHRFLATADDESFKAIEAVLQLMNEKGLPFLGHAMTLLINAAADCSCAEAFVARGVVPRTMRLLDVLETTDQPIAPILREMSLMLLNNLTASHVTAVSTLLQLDDEDLKGFYLSRLKLFFDRQPEDSSHRDVRKWILQIGVNVTRVPEGQVAMSEDDEWMTLLTELLQSAREHSTKMLFASLAAQALQNCANSKCTHDNLCKTKLVTHVITLLLSSGAPTLQLELQQSLVEILAGLMQSETGMQKLEEHNTKKLLQGQCNVYPAGEGAQKKQTSAAAAAASTGDGDSDTSAAAAPSVLHLDVVRFVEVHVLPFLDDIQDAFVMQGSDE